LREDTVVTVHSFKENIIVGLTPVGDHHILIAMLKGFYILDIRQYFEHNTLSFLYYNHLNGMTGFEPVINALYIDNHGVLWMPTTNCVVSFDPQKLIGSISPPVLHIQSLETSEDNIRWEQTHTDRREFSHRYKNVRFQFIGIKYSAVENVRYRYRLLGFQNDWSEPTKSRELTFNNLPPGNYLFEIYADAGTDDSRCETQSLAFSIKPAFWQTWWFITFSLLSLMLASALVALYVQRRKNRELLQRLTMEKQLNDLRIKSIRLKAIPHFNANVLSAIEFYIMNRSKEEANRLLGIYSDFTYQTLREVDKASRSLQEELDYVQLYLQLEKLRFADKFDFELDIDPSVNKEVQLPNMVLHTYCENAIKHAFATFKSGGILKIRVRQQHDSVTIAVEDNGVGRIAAGINTQVRSTKQGLEILNRQIEIYNRFNLNKIKQKIDDLTTGTRFTVEVPLGFAYI
jgi:signal transduction histidine kinase